jgi:predicted TIM-barrel fold metal-dependent hydrolase
MSNTEKTYEDYEIFDAHTHVYPAKISAKAAMNIGRFYGLPPNHNGSVDELLINGNKCGVKGYLVCSVATSPEQVHSINDFIADECAKHPEFIGFGALHPMMDDIGGEIDRIIKLGLRGIKLHPDFQRFNIDAPEAYSIYEAAEDRLPILFHIGDDRYDYSHPRRLSKILGDFKNLKAIAAHLGGYKVWDEASKYLENLMCGLTQAAPRDCSTGKRQESRYGCSERTGVFSERIIRYGITKARCATFYHSALKTMKTGGYCPQISKRFYRSADSSRERKDRRGRKCQATV